MKSYFLEGISSCNLAKEALNHFLPGQADPWLLRDKSGDVVAYFHIAESSESELNRPAITAEISGRHFKSDTEVISMLILLQKAVGGYVTNDQ